MHIGFYQDKGLQEGHTMTIYCDSSTREACFVIEGQDPVVIAYLEPVTVNVGEYTAVILALREARQQGLKQVSLLTDSKLIAHQINGSYRCRAKHLLPFRNSARLLLEELAGTIDWDSRELNLAGKVLE